MRGFFHGWKRKVGCATLALACLFTAGWLRSVGNLDVIYLNTTKSNLVLLSGCGRFRIAVNTQYSIMTMSQEPNHRILKICPDNTFMPNNVYHGSNERFKWSSTPANELGIFENINDKSESLMIPYWSIVSPLILLCFWLLLSKPKKPADSNYRTGSQHTFDGCPFSSSQ